MYFFTADEHYGHENIIKYCNRPFKDVDEMNDTLVSNHNKVVRARDVVIHAGDFEWKSTHHSHHLLNGNHIFLKGSHDSKASRHFSIWEEHIEGQLVVVCHYAMRRWRESHYNSWHLFGHSHGKLEPIGKSWDIGVDNNNFFPLSFEQIKEIMNNRPDNPEWINKEKHHDKT